MWIQTGVTVRKRLSWVVTSVTLTFDLWPWPFARTSHLSKVTTSKNFMMIRWWEHSQKGVTDRQTDRLNQSLSCLVAAKKKHQSSALLAFVWGIHRDRWIARTKDQLRGKCFHLMTSSCNESVKESKMPCCHTKEQLHNYIIKHGFDAINTHGLCVCLWKSKYLQSLRNHVYVIVI